MAQVSSCGEAETPWLTDATASIDSPPQASPHFRQLRSAISSYLDAEVGSIDEEPRAWRRRVCVGMVIGADGDSTVRSDHPDGARRCRRSGVSCARQLCLIGQV